MIDDAKQFMELMMTKSSDAKPFIELMITKTYYNQQDCRFELILVWLYLQLLYVCNNIPADDLFQLFTNKISHFIPFLH